MGITRSSDEPTTSDPPAAPASPRRPWREVVLGLVFAVSAVVTGVLPFFAFSAERLRVTCGSERCTVAVSDLLGAPQPIGTYPLGALERTSYACRTKVDAEGRESEECSVAFVVDGWTPIDPRFVATTGQRITLDKTLPGARVINERTGVALVPYQQVKVTRRRHDRDAVDLDALRDAQHRGGRYAETLGFVDLPLWGNVVAVAAPPLVAVTTILVLRRRPPSRPTRQEGRPA